MFFQNTTCRISLWLILLMLVVGSFFSILIPPLQSPDEADHIERAYLLSKGTIILDVSKDLNASGGMIDSGLIDYAAAYAVLNGKPDRKLSAEEIDSAKSIKWTGIKQFNPAPGTGFYFPVIYTPQAMGLALGEQLGLSIDTSYRLARFMVLAAIALILVTAFKTYPASPLTIALLILPMSVFQFSSASLDGISTALAVFSIATFLRITDEKIKANPWLFYALTLSVVLLATSRIHLLPLLTMVLVAGFYTKNKKHIYVFALALLLVLAWLVIAIKTTAYPRIAIGTSTASVAWFYLKNPLAFFNVLIATLSNSELVTFYRDSFLGVLGWLDTRFSEKTYEYLFKYTLLIGLLSVSVKNLKTEWLPQLIVLFSGLVSIFLIFFALLITWNPHPANMIQGIQGRYFLVPMIMIAYAISSGTKLHGGIIRKTALILVILLGMFTLFDTSRLLLERYYLMSEQQPEPIATVMTPSAPLDLSNPIILSLTRDRKLPLKRLGIVFGTYMRKNPGRAELQLATLDGRVVTMPFDLADLVDNHYKYFELDAESVASAKIVYLTGGGISAWEAHSEKGSLETCLIFEYENGSRRYTPGCPRSD